jgi:hypothetical protein
MAAALAANAALALGPSDSCPNVNVAVSGTM